MNKLIIDALKPLSIPVSFQIYTGAAPTYITFFEYLQQIESYCDDEEKVEGHYMQIDIWSKGNYNSIVTQAKSLLKEAGFRRTFETELFEEDTKIYHKVIRVFKEISI